MRHHNISSRREFIKYAGTASAATMLAGCSNSGGGSSSGNGPVKFGMVPAESTDAPQVHLVTEYMEKKFGTKGEIQFMENNSLITQSLSAKQVQVGEGGFGGTAALVDSGKDVQAFGTHQTNTDYVFVGTDEYATPADVVNNNATIGIGSTTGLETLQTAGLLLQEDLIDGISDLKLQQIGFSSARLQSMLKENPPIDATAIHFNQWQKLKAERPNFNMIANFGKELDPWVQVAWFGFSDVLKEREDQLAELIAAEVMLHKELNNDYKLYKDIVRQYVPGGGPSDDELQKVYDYLTQVKVWPTSLDVWNKEGVDTMMTTMNAIGITESKVSPDEVMNTSIRDAAQDLLDDN